MIPNPDFNTVILVTGHVQTLTHLQMRDEEFLCSHLLGHTRVNASFCRKHLLFGLVFFGTVHDLHMEQNPAFPAVAGLRVAVHLLFNVLIWVQNVQDIF